MKASCLALLLAAGAMLSPVASTAQEITGTPGAPDARRILEGLQLPPLARAFGGKIERNAAAIDALSGRRGSRRRRSAPNVLLIMHRRRRLRHHSTFGGVIPTPALDRVAEMGLRFTNMHSTALCSPTRAALITGRNHHSVGFGVIAEQATGFPGYNVDHLQGQGDGRHAS